MKMNIFDGPCPEKGSHSRLLQVRASGSWQNFLISGFFKIKKILTRQLPSSASRQGHVRIFGTVPCQDFLKQAACTGMHLQWNLMRFCAMLAWPRAHVRIFFLDGQLGWAVSGFFSAWAGWAGPCQDLFCEFQNKNPDMAK